MKSLLSLCLITTLFLLSLSHIGCSSYSFRGAHSPAPKVIMQNNEKYQLRNYHIDVREGLSSWSIAQFSGSKIVKSDIEKELIEKYQNKFDNKGKLFDVKINCKPSEYSFFGVLPYLLSLGVYPANIAHYKDTCEVLVSLNDIVKKGEVKFRSNGWLSSMSPFGLNQTDQMDEYNGTYHFGSGILKAPHLTGDCFEKQKNVFITEVGMEILTCITEIENDEALSNLNKQQNHKIENGEENKEAQ